MEGAKRLPGLDGLRALSILLVLLLHVSHRPGFPQNAALKNVASIGGFGVEVFFVISGFLITGLLLNEEERAGSFSLRRFYFRRGFRILPPALAFLAVMAAMDRPLHLQVSWQEFAASALFFRNLVNGSQVLGHYWSLSIEEQFYLCWPVLLRMLPRDRRLSMTLLLCLFAPVWRQINMEVFGAAHVNFLRADLRYDGLLFGAALALLNLDVRFKSLIQRASVYGVPILLVAVGVVAGLLALPDRTPGMIRWIVPTIQYACVAIVIQVATRGRAGIFGKILEFELLTWIGRLSYTLYLWQQFFCFPDFERTTTRFPIDVVLSVCVAAIAFYVIERPVLVLRDRIVWKRTSSGHVGSPPA